MRGNTGLGGGTVRGAEARHAAMGRAVASRKATGGGVSAVRVVDALHAGLRRADVTVQRRQTAIVVRGAWARAPTDLSNVGGSGSRILAATAAVARARVDIEIEVAIAGR
jgi:hypothetical protein